MPNESPLDHWRQHTLDDAASRGVEGLRDALSQMAHATARLRAADWNDDARSPTARRGDTDGAR